MDAKLDHVARLERVARSTGMPTFADFGDLIANDRPGDNAWIWFWSDVHDGQVGRAFPPFWEAASSRWPGGTVREIIDAWPPEELKLMWLDFLYGRH